MIRVLIVDDQQLLRRGLKLLLAQSPEIQVVTTCASAAETLVSLHNSEVDVVLADAVMPGMDGPELVEQCRTLWPSLPVIILTTFDDATIVRRSIWLFTQRRLPHHACGGNHRRLRRPPLCGPTGSALARSS